MRIPMGIKLMVKNRQQEFNKGLLTFTKVPYFRLCNVCNQRATEMNQFAVRQDRTAIHSTDINQFKKNKKTVEEAISDITSGKVIDNLRMKHVIARMSYGEVGKFTKAKTPRGQLGALRRELKLIEDLIERYSYNYIKYNAFVCSDECFNMLVLSLV